VSACKVIECALRNHANSTALCVSRLANSVDGAIARTATTGVRIFRALSAAWLAASGSFDHRALSLYIIASRPRINDKNHRGGLVDFQGSMHFLIQP